MATIAGSQFGATAPGLDVQIVATTTGTGLPEPLASPPNFNLETYVGSLAGAPGLAAGYQGLAILSPSGSELDLVNGAYAVTDYGSGLDTLNAYGGSETISGGGAAVTLNLYGSGELAAGGGPAAINVYGNSNTVEGANNDTIGVYGSLDTIDGGSGSDTIDVSGAQNTVDGDSGYHQIGVNSSNDTVNAGTGNDTITVAGSDDLVNASSGGTQITVNGSFDTVDGAGNDTIGITGFDDDVINGSADGTDQVSVSGSFDTVNAGGAATDTIAAGGTFNAVAISGIDAVNISGSDDTVTAGALSGANQGQVSFAGTGQTFADGPNAYTDTVVGFSQAAGDSIHLTGSNTVAAALANSSQVGSDTLITLNDTSTILLKGVTHIDSTFFS